MASLFDPQTLTAGGYAMESVAWFTGSLMMVQRLAGAMSHTREPAQLIAVLNQRVAKFAIALAVLFFMGFLNRFKWFRAHTFSDSAYVHFTYEALFVSVVVTACLFTIVNNINGRTDTTFGIKNNRVLLAGSLVSFVVASAYYMVNR